MNPAVFDWAVWMAEWWNLRGDVLEVGSRNVNGTVRPVFQGPVARARSYWGIDLEAGEGVDEVADVMTWAPLRPFYDGIVATEVLEHVPDPEAFLERLRWLTKIGGWLLLTTRGPGFPRHGYPIDNMRRWTPATLRAQVKKAAYAPLSSSEDPTPDQPGAFVLAVRLR